jgi:hypothetical protein
MYIVFFTIVFCSLFFTNNVFGKEYKLKLIVDLKQFEDSNGGELWLNPLANPINDDVFFVAKDNGLIYLAKQNNENNQETILDLPLALNTSAFVSLTAISLHPSFTLSAEQGYATFYTAHTTEFEKQKYNNRLALIDSNIEFAFETVITAWTYDFERQKIDLQSQREVIRIPIKNHNAGIQQLTFNPYLKPWNDDYGQLYFSLGYVDELKEYSLYSGAILCISPLVFGFHNYTVSESNPFVKTPEINDEVVVLGGQNVEHFFWAKYSHEAIFIEHNNKEQYWFSKAKVGSNLDSLHQSSLLKFKTNEMSTMLLYQGRDFPSLRNSMVFLSLLDKKWHLNSLPLDSLSDEFPPSRERIITEYLSPKSVLSIHQNNHNELIVFDSHQSRLYSLQLANIDIPSNDLVQPTQGNFGPKYYVLFIGLFIVLLSAYFFIRRDNGVPKLLLDSLVVDYVRFDYVLTKETILIFKINQKKAHKTLYLKNITRCEVTVNNKLINIIDYEPENAISNQIETDMRNLFTSEQNKEILEEQTRQIQIILTDKDSSYTICPYLRKGNNRVTSVKYYIVVDMIIDLCWGISKQINSQNTEVRKVSTVPFPRPNLPVTDNHKTHSNQQNKFNGSNSKLEKAKPMASQGKISPQTELIDALDKLVNLHKQGYLSDEEFSLAKSNLLRADGD